MSTTRKDPMDPKTAAPAQSPMDPKTTAPTQTNVLAFVLRQSSSRPHQQDEQEMSDEEFAEGLRRLLVGERREMARLHKTAQPLPPPDQEMTEAELICRLRALLVRERRRASRAASNQNSKNGRGNKAG